MKYPVYNQQGEKVKDVELNPAVFEVAVNDSLVHQVVVAQAANRRTVVAHTKQRGEVKGGGRKPHRQKGSGRARAGSIRSPLWKGGGVTFGPTKERNFGKKINKKMKSKALLMSLSDKAANQKLILLDDLKLESAKTRLANELLSKLFKNLEIPNKSKSSAPGKFGYKIMLITPDTRTAVIRASNNLSKVKVIRADSLNVRDTVEADWLLVLVGSLNIIDQIYPVRHPGSKRGEVQTSQRGKVG